LKNTTKTQNTLFFLFPYIAIYFRNFPITKKEKFSPFHGMARYGTMIRQKVKKIRTKKNIYNKI
jgi:hypothetical protein